jgi:hypothetical protein
MADALNSHAARGTLGLLLGVGLILWPPSINFIAATVLVAASVREFRESFRVLEAVEEAA